MPAKTVVKEQKVSQMGHISVSLFSFCMLSSSSLIVVLICAIVISLCKQIEDRLSCFDC